MEFAQERHPKQSIRVVLNLLEADVNYYTLRFLRLSCWQRGRFSRTSTGPAAAAQRAASLAPTLRVGTVDAGYDSMPTILRRVQAR